MRLAVTSAAGVGTRFGLGIETGVEGFFEDDVLDEGLIDDELLNDLSLLVDSLTDNHSLALGLEQNTTGGDGLGTTIILGGCTDATETDLEDADAVEANLLTQLEEVLQGTTELIKDGLDIGLLHCGLSLDELSQLLGLDEALIVDRCGEPLAIGCGLVVLVLDFTKLLAHFSRI